MNPLIRKLKIYELIGSTDVETIETYNWIVDTFGKSKHITQDDGNILYTNGKYRLMLQNIKDKIISVDNETIWSYIETKVDQEQTHDNIYIQTQEVINYIMNKYFNVKEYEPSILYWW